MKHFFLICGLLLALIGGATVLPPFPDLAGAARPQLLARQAPLADTVYVCLGAHAGHYHYSRTCERLTRCGHPVQLLEAAEAKHRGKLACRYCLVLEV